MPVRPLPLRWLLWSLTRQGLLFLRSHAIALSGRVRRRLRRAVRRQQKETARCFGFAALCPMRKPVSTNAIRSSLSFALRPGDQAIERAEMHARIAGEPASNTRYSPTRKTRARQVFTDVGSTDGPQQNPAAARAALARHPSAADHWSRVVSASVVIPMKPRGNSPGENRETTLRLEKAFPAKIGKPPYKKGNHQ